MTLSFIFLGHGHRRALHRAQSFRLLGGVHRAASGSAACAIRSRRPQHPSVLPCGCCGVCGELRNCDARDFVLFGEIHAQTVCLASVADSENGGWKDIE